jgi:mannose-6-phosphate isomerase-like protein (cupin superfamily)
MAEENESWSPMHIIRKEDLPLIGSSYNFVGANHENVEVSLFLVEAKPGHGAPRHYHDYDEIVFVPEGSSRFVSGDEIRDTSPGDILVVKAGTPHGFVNTGTDILKQIDIHLSPRFEQTNLAPTETSRAARLPQ